MKTKIQTVIKATCLFCLVFLFAVPFPASARQALSTEQIVQNTANTLFKAAGFTSKITYQSGNICYYNSSDGIVIGNNYLKIKKGNHNDETFRFIICFLLSHELAHKMQYDSLGAANMNTSYCERKQLYECQADIIAGIWLNKIYHFNHNTGRFSENDYKNLLSFVYDIGENENQFNTHPSHEQRRNAIRMGIAYEIYRYDPSNNSQTFDQLILKTNEGLFKWSFRIAKYIVHYPQFETRNIGVYSVGDSANIRWNETAPNPTVEFGEKYINYSDHPIILYLQYRILGIMRENEDPRNIALQGKVLNDSVLVNSHDTVSVNGKLNWWGTATHSSMPKLVSPPERESLYYAENSNASGNDFSDCGVINYNATTTENGSIAPLNAILIINDAFLTNFESLKSGMAILDESSQQLTYSTKIPVGAGFTTSLAYDLKEKKNSVSLEFYDGKSQTEANAAFKRVIQILLKLNEDKSVTIRDDYRALVFADPEKYQVENKIVLRTKDDIFDMKEINAKFESTKMPLTATLSYHKSDKEYSVSIDF